MDDDHVNDSRVIPPETSLAVSNARVKQLERGLEKEKKDHIWEEKWATVFSISTVICLIAAFLGWGLLFDKEDALETSQKNLKEAKTEVTELKSTCRWQGGSARYWYHEYQRVGEKVPNNTSTNVSAEENRKAFEAYAAEQNKIAQQQREQWDAKQKFAEEIVKSWLYKPVPSKPDGKLFINTLPCDIATYPVIVDYSITLEEIIKAGKISKDCRIKPEDFPAQRTGKAKIRMKFVHFKHDLDGRRLSEELSRIGLRPADLYELAAFSAAYPDLRSEFSIVAFGSENPKDEYVIGRAIPYLGRSASNSGNYFGVISDTINFDTGHWMFAAVPK